MKSFTLFISAAIVASSAAINEPVSSPTAAVERELAEYERQLGTDVTGTPTATPGRPTSGVSCILLHILSESRDPLLVVFCQCQLRECGAMIFECRRAHHMMQCLFYLSLHCTQYTLHSTLYRAIHILTLPMIPAPVLANQEKEAKEARAPANQARAPANQARAVPPRAPKETTVAMDIPTTTLSLVNPARDPRVLLPKDPRALLPRDQRLLRRGPRADLTPTPIRRWCNQLHPLYIVVSLELDLHPYIEYILSVISGTM